MILTGTIIAALLVAYLGAALAQSFQLGITVRQAALYLPLKLVYRIHEGNLRITRLADAPVIYAVAHQSDLDPALMLALLPDDTLHILDERSAAAFWLEPYRTLGRSIAFNAEHVFVSRRLVRHLRGKGRLAVYFPQTVEPDAKSFRLFRAVSRIAVKAGADIVPIHIDGARHLPFSLAPVAEAPRRWFPRLSIGTLSPVALEAMSDRAGRPPGSHANALFDRIAEARVAASSRPRTLFSAFTRAARQFGADRIIVEDTVTGTLTYRRLLMAARVLGGRFAAVS
ncbi:MAG: 2-acyl-glycerophospho-ethanolamine acyltransferase, partial [Mesorhizobium sp.]|nr:2-acyl-glycerophospho-ethanolamine acyltransferase [Mesorhizobium sp.]